MRIVGFVALAALVVGAIASCGANRQSSPDPAAMRQTQWPTCINERMLQAREGGNIIGAERIAVMAALNVTHEYLGLVRDNDQQRSTIESSLTRLTEKLGATIASTGGS